jgi:2-haloalkanoic acid dehalogenase type II
VPPATLPVPEAIAFDCYRTLLQNDPADWERTFGDISREQGLRISGKDLWDAWKKHEVHFRASRLDLDNPELSPPFKTYEAAWAECFDKAFADASLNGDPVRAARRCVEHMSRRPPFPETAKALRMLSGRARLAVLSNADEAFLRPALWQTGVRYAAVVSSESAQAYKPSPQAYGELLRLLGIQPERVWYVGDHLHEDMYGSSEAGMTAIWVNRPSGQGYYAGQVGLDPARRREPHAEVADLRELAGLLDVAKGASRSAR